VAELLLPLKYPENLDPLVNAYLSDWRLSQRCGATGDMQSKMTISLLRLLGVDKLESRLLAAFVQEIMRRHKNHQIIKIQSC
jgi:hypothetical protein